MPRRFVHTSRIDAPVAEVFAFHQRPDALALLTPPWDQADIIQPPRSLEIGTRVILRTHIGPLPFTIEAEHVEFDPPFGFADRMLRGPFPFWYHRHHFEPDGNATRLIDDVSYELPFGALGGLFGEPIARRRLEKLFAFRHEVTRRACEKPAINR